MSTEQTNNGSTETPEITKPDGPKAKPHIILPGDEVTINESAENLFKHMADEFFVFGDRVVELVTSDDGTRGLDLLEPEKARSEFERFGQLFVWRVGQKGAKVLKPAICPLDTAKALLASGAARRCLRRVNGLINCPVIYEHEGQLKVAGPGYDPQTKRLITGGAMPPEVPIDEAVEKLLGLVSEFDFQSDGDRSRAVMSFLTPQLKLGGFIKGPVPVDVAEADQSQSGKTYRQKCGPAICNEKVSIVTNRKGGVGSFDESLSQALVTGWPFVQLDNFRGRLDSPHLEALVTAEGSFSCRIPRQGEIQIRPENFFISLTSNGVDVTPDFANRSSIIRIRKKPPGFAFRKYPEGDLLTHIRANQAYYLGCVFAVIREWHAKGKPKTDETRHDFRDWVQIVDWIVQNIFKLAPVMDGHVEAQQRVSNPDLVFLRAIALAIAKGKRFGEPLIASQISSICEMEAINFPGIGERSPDADRGMFLVGSAFGRLFKESNTLLVDGIRVERLVDKVPRNNGNGYIDSKLYIFTKATDPATLDPATPAEVAKTPMPHEPPFPTIYREPGVGTIVSFEGNPFQKNSEEKAAVNK